MDILKIKNESLWYACLKSSLEEVKNILEGGADPNIYYTNSKFVKLL